MKRKKIPRRERCYVVSKRARLLEGRNAARAWMELAIILDRLSDKDVPKFDDLLKAIRTATIKGVKR